MVGTMAAMAAIAGDFKVSGSIAGLPDGTQVALAPMSYVVEKPLVTGTVQGGEFMLSGTVAEPMCVNLMVPGSYGYIQLMVDDEEMSVEAVATVTKADDGTPRYAFSDIKVAGSPLTDKLWSFTSVRDAFNAIRSSFEERYAGFFKERDEAFQAKDSVRIAALDNSEVGKNMMSEDKVFFEGVEKAYNGVILGNKDSYW